ncbi:hypothetical protein L916_02296, partial [Phytophthora nicotianae]
SSRPAIVHSSRRDYGFQPRDAAETARRAAQQRLDTYVCGPAAATADEQVLRHPLCERYLTPQVTTPQEYRERLQLQLNRQSVPSIRTVRVVLNPAPGGAVARYDGVPAPDVPDHKRPRCQGNHSRGKPQTPKSYAYHVVVELTMLIEQIRMGGGGESPVDLRVAITCDLRALKQRVGSLNQFVDESKVSGGRLADGLEVMHRRVDWFDKPQTVQNRVADLERQVAQLQGQLDMLLRLQQLGSRSVALPLAVPQPAVAVPPAFSQRRVVAQPAADERPLFGSAPATLRSPEQDQDMA